MKPPRHFIANIASRYFTSVALNASQIPICRVVMAHWWLQFAHVIAQYTQMLFMQHLQIARVIAVVFWRQSYYSHYGCYGCYGYHKMTLEDRGSVGTRRVVPVRVTRVYIVNMHHVPMNTARRVPTLPRIKGGCAFTAHPRDDTVRVFTRQMRTFTVFTVPFCVVRTT